MTAVALATVRAVVADKPQLEQDEIRRVADTLLGVAEREGYFGRVALILAALELPVGH